MLKKFLLLSLISLFLASCKEEEPRPKEPVKVENQAEEEKKLLEQKALKAEHFYLVFNQKLEEVINLTENPFIKKVSLKNISYSKSLDKAIGRYYLDIYFTKKFANKKISLIIEDNINFKNPNNLMEIKRHFQIDDYGLIHFAENLSEVAEFKHLFNLLDKNLDCKIELFENGKVLINSNLEKLELGEYLNIAGIKGSFEFELKIKENSLQKAIPFHLKNIELKFNPLKYKNLEIDSFSFNLKNDKNFNREIIISPLHLYLGATDINLGTLRILDTNLNYELNPDKEHIRFYHQNQNVSLDKFKLETLILGLELKNLNFNKELINKENQKTDFHLKLDLELGDDFANSISQTWGFYNKHLNLDFRFFDFDFEALKSLDYLLNNFDNLKEKEKRILLLSIFNNTAGKFEAKLILDKIGINLRHQFAEKLRLNNFKNNFILALQKSLDYSNLNLEVRALEEVLNNEKFLQLPYIQYLKENSQLSGGVYSLNLEKNKQDFKVKF